MKDIAARKPIVKKYELVIVVDGKASSAKKKATVEKVSKLVKTLEGTVVSTTDWGTKELSYPMKKLTSGTYFIFELELTGTAAKAINERLRLEEDILRYLVMTVEKSLVRIKNQAKESVAKVEDEQKSK